MCNYPILFVEGYMNCKENVIGMKWGKKKRQNKQRKMTRYSGQNLYQG